MFLFIGALFLGVGIVVILQIYVYKKVPRILSHVITFALGMLFIVTATVHGIWLGLMIMIVGFLWLKVSKKDPINNTAD